MLTRVLNMFRVADLRNKIIFTLAMIGLYRLGSFIPAPGVDIEAVQGLRDQANQSGLLGYMQLFSGGALTQFAITTPRICMMIDEVMYGMIPSAKIANWVSAPPENSCM